MIRSAAFREAGWSPEYTLTEDYALGMVLKMNRWKCRYVEEYLAVGEAPDEVRNCFQQRSRWTKVGCMHQSEAALPSGCACSALISEAACLPAPQAWWLASSTQCHAAGGLGGSGILLVVRV